MVTVLTTFIGILAGYLIAVWQNRRSDKQSEALETTLAKLPLQIKEALRAGTSIVDAVSKRLTNLEEMA